MEGRRLGAAKAAGRRLSTMNRIMVMLGLSVSMLLGTGLLALYGASDSDLEPGRLLAHTWHIGVGLGCCLMAAFLDHRCLDKSRMAQLLILITIAALGAVLVPGLGEKINHARRWYVFGGQPSAFAQLALISFLAHYCARYQDRMQERAAGFLRPGFVVGTIVVLIFVEPDWGTAILSAAVATTILLIAGAHWGYLLSSAIIGAELLVLALCSVQDKMQRLITFLDPERFQQEAGWQVWASLLSLGVGHWFGYPGGGVLKYQYVAEQNTDFILSRIGEDFGLAGTTLVLFNYVSIVGVGLFLCWRTRDTFGQLLALGLTCLIGFQALINIAVVTSTLPNKGIPLPFVSYGGSSMVAMLTAVGLLFSLARRAAPLPQPQPGATRLFA